MDDVALVDGLEVVAVVVLFFGWDYVSLRRVGIGEKAWRCASRMGSCGEALLGAYRVVPENNRVNYLLI